MKLKAKTIFIPALLSLLPLLFGFADVPEDHWAADAVNKLAAEGTVSGFDDETFMPDEPVTRAQFVKMLGFETSARTDYIPDLKHSHWAYTYLIKSPLRKIDGNILPDLPATREQVAVYIYDCYANGGKQHAPSVITKGLEYPNEVGWVYEHGIMVGNDGLSLRLDENITRAEAAVLIVNSRNKLETVENFEDQISDSVLEQVFNNSGLFDTPYSASSTITNGEAAKAAYRLRLDRTEAVYYTEEADFEHKYANDLKAMEPILGPGRISAEFADKEAEPEDVLAMLAYAMASKVHKTIAYGMTGNYYADAVLKSPTLDGALTFSYENGIFPLGGGALGSGKPITHKTIAAALLQYDMLWGLQTSVTVDRDTSLYNDESMRFEDLPENAALFKGILKSVPNDVYLMPFELSEGMTAEAAAPVNGYAFFNDLKSGFSQLLANAAVDIYEQYGVSVSFTFYPQLVYDNGEGFTVRAKVEITDAGSGAVPSSEIFPGSEDAPLKNGDTFWAEYAAEYMFFDAL